MSISNNAAHHPKYDSPLTVLFPSLVLIQDTVLESESYKDQLDSVIRVLENCEVWVNFWGVREIVSDTEGVVPIVPVSLNEVIRKTIVAYLDLQKDRTLTKEEHELRTAFVEKIQKFFSRSDAQVANANIITRFFNFIRERLHPLHSISESDFVLRLD